MNTSDIHSEAKPVDRIADLLDSIKLYLDPEKYTFNYAKVEQLAHGSKTDGGANCPGCKAGKFAG